MDKLYEFKYRYIFDKFKVFGIKFFGFSLFLFVELLDI